MQNSFADFFGFSLVPEVFSEIATGPSSDIHFFLVGIVTLGTFSFSFMVYYDFSVKFAFVTVV